MNYFEAFEKLKNVLEKAESKEFQGHFTIQVCILDQDASGIFYIEALDNKIIIEPYNYYDNDAEIFGTIANLQLLFEGKLELIQALNNGTLTANGNIDSMNKFFESFSKTSTKKSASKKTTKTKNTVKKTEATKMTDDTKNKDNNKKSTEPIKDVVENEIRPKKK